MKKYTLTDEHRAQLKPWADKWIANGLSTKPMDDEDRTEMKKAIKGMYEAAGLTPPPDHRIVFVPSPFATIFASGFAASIWWRRGNSHATATATYAATRDAADAATATATYAATRDAADAATRDATDDATYAATYAATRDATDDATYAATRDAADDATYAATYAATRDVALKTFEKTKAKNKNYYTDCSGFIAAGNSLGVGKFGFECAASSWRMLQGGNFWSWSVAFLSFFKDVAKLQIDYSKYEHWEKAAIHGSVRIMHKNFCMISDRPRILKLDDQGRGHCENAPYIQWSDGTGIYMWHGVPVPGEWIEDRSTLTPEIALSWENVEQRRAACEMLGWNNVLEHPSLNPKIIDADEPHIGTLIQVDLPDAPAQWFLKYRCGTGRWFAEAVNDKKYNTALKANAAGNGWRGVGDPISFIPFIRS